MPAPIDDRSGVSPGEPLSSGVQVSTSRTRGDLVHDPVSGVRPRRPIQLTSGSSTSRTRRHGHSLCSDHSLSVTGLRRRVERPGATRGCCHREHRLTSGHGPSGELPFGSHAGSRSAEYRSSERNSKRTSSGSTRPPTGGTPRRVTLRPRLPRSGFSSLRHRSTEEDTTIETGERVVDGAPHVNRWLVASGPALSTDRLVELPDRDRRARL